MLGFDSLGVASVAQGQAQRIALAVLAAPAISLASPAAAVAGQRVPVEAAMAVGSVLEPAIGVWINFGAVNLAIDASVSGRVGVILAVDAREIALASALDLAPYVAARIYTEKTVFTQGAVAQAHITGLVEIDVIERPRFVVRARIEPAVGISVPPLQILEIVPARHGASARARHPRIQAALS
ncbi:hypothetical protein [Nitratireductor thuwali]|uniref:hypothetical protein n=1 Tax=Nitratireductor thuwali TaxID=2267699 RepID=UPI0030D59822